MEHTTPLLLACQCGSVDVVKLLLANGSPVWGVDAAQMSAPMVAAASKHAGVLQVLLEHVRNENGDGGVTRYLEVQDGMGRTALHWARDAHF